MGLMDGLGNLLFGKTNVGSHSTMTSDQRNLLNQLSQLQGNYAPGTLSTLYGNAINPQSSYSSLNNWEDEFNTGVVQPYLRQSDEDWGNLRHKLGSSRFSSKSDAANTNFLNDRNSYLNQQRYNTLMNERNMQMNSQEQAYNRQQNSLASLLGSFGSTLNTKAFENTAQQSPGLLSIITGLKTLTG